MERVTISKKYSLSNSDGILIVEAVEAAKLAKSKKEEEKRRKKEKEEREKEEKRQAHADKKRKREDITCKVEECKRIWKNKSRFDEEWLWCSTCDGFGICWGCGEDKVKRRKVFTHERACKKGK